MATIIRDRHRSRARAPRRRPAGRGLVAGLLADYGAVVRAALEPYLRDREPRRYLYDLVGDYPRRGGGTLRSGLLLAATRALGGRLAEALPSAVGLELLASAMRVHDDVEDGSETRRGRPALHVEHGVPLAVNAGDALTVTSLRPLLANRGILGPLLAMRVVQESLRMTRELTEGQALELGWRRDGILDLGLDDYFAMVLRKRCWLNTIYPLRAGALIATGDAVVLDRLTPFGFFLGAAHEIRSELLELAGAPGRCERSRGESLRDGTRTLPLILLYQRATAVERRRLRELLARPRAERGAVEVAWLRERMIARGTLERAGDVARGLAAAARREHTRLFGRRPPTPDLRFLARLPRWAVERS